MIEIRKCSVCGKEFNALLYDPHYDKWGLMGTGYISLGYICSECDPKTKQIIEEVKKRRG